MKDLTRRNFMKSVAATTAGLGMGSLGNVTLAFADDDSSSGVDTTVYSAAECYQEGYEICVDVEAEGAVLLKNENSVLPLAEGTKVTLLGSMSYNYVLGGDGQGNDDSDTVMMDDAFTEAGMDVNEAAWSWLEEQCGGSRGLGDYDPSGEGNWLGYTTIKEFSIDVYEDAKDTILADGYTDYAIVTIGRSGAEGASPSLDLDGDGSTLTGATYLEIGDDERDLLSFCAENFTHTIVLVNTGNAMELGFLEEDAYNVEAALYIGMPGESGVVGVGTLLTGRTNPSGRLVDTLAYDMTTNPTYYNTDDNRYANADNQTFYQYEEGIYVGYRYFETADAAGYFDSDEFKSITTFKNGAVEGYDQVVQYPFGYGLSYTTFTEEITASDVALEAGGTNSITVTVTNTGDLAGKRVVELYMDAPYQTDTENFGIKGVGLEKSKVVLIGFEKTSEIEAGGSEDVTITFDTDDLASFDNFGQGCYVLEAGTYKFNIQDDAHQWGDEGSDNAPNASLSVELSASIIYDDEGSVSGATYAGARSSDLVVAKNCMDDVTAGDGNMLDGYLSRNDFAGGMAVIMQHTSDEDPNEYLRDEAVEALNVTAADCYEYSFETYINGEKTTLTKNIYSHGADMIPSATETPDGTDVTDLEEFAWDQTYYVVEGETDDDGNIYVVDEEPTDGDYHVLSIEDMDGVPIDTELGEAIWDKLACMTSISEAIEVQGNSGWNIPAISSLGMPKLKCNDAYSEAYHGNGAAATFFPSEPVLTATWNRDLAIEAGAAHAHQDTLYSIHYVYGPGMNTHRSPFGGRNYEYFAEDGFVAGEVGGSWIKGCQSANVGVFAKHCGLNDGDTNRGGNTTWANEQAIREIYQRPYEIAIKKYIANGIMGSMNRVGLQWMPYGMFVTMMRDEWGYKGIFLTDSDGGSGDAYNNPQVMLASRGIMLSISLYVDDSATVAAYGDATSTPFGNNMLHYVIRDVLYSYYGAKVVDDEGNVTSGVSASSTTTSSSSSSVPVAGIVGGVVAVAAVAAVAGVALSKKKKKAAEGEGTEDKAKAKAAKDDVDDDDESQA